MEIKEFFYEWWTKNECPGRDYSIEKIKNLKKNVENPEFKQWMEKIKVSEIRQYIKDFKENINDKNTDEDLIIQNVQLCSTNQKLKDKIRIDGKTAREYYRVANSIYEFNQELINILKQKENDISKFTIKHESINNKKIGVLTLFDLHLNELIDLPFNKYDFNIASKRLKLFAIKAIEIFNLHKITDIKILFGGDIINSDRRRDELLSMATNRSKATILSVYLLEQFIIELNQHYNIEVYQVTGNEGRVNDEFGWSDIVASDNYDFTVFNILKFILRKTPIRFFEGNPVEIVIPVLGYNWVLTHGNNIPQDGKTAIRNICAKHSFQENTTRFIVYGDKHESQICDYSSRSSSLCGGNAYSDSGLSLASRAAQNIHIAYDNGNIDSIKLDLQKTDNINGYEIMSQLEAYNAKSVSKLKDNKVIMEIVI